MQIYSKIYRIDTQEIQQSIIYKINLLISIIIMVDRKQF